VCVAARYPPRSIGHPATPPAAGPGVAPMLRVSKYRGGSLGQARLEECFRRFALGISGGKFSGSNCAPYRMSSTDSTASFFPASPRTNKLAISVASPRSIICCNRAHASSICASSPRSGIKASAASAAGPPSGTPPLHSNAPSPPPGTGRLLTPRGWRNNHHKVRMPRGEVRHGWA